MPESETIHRVPQTVACVDDDPVIRMIYEHVLAEKGFTVWTCASGEELLERLHTTVPDLLVLDLMMPGMTGLQVLEHLRKQPEVCTLPVIIVSASESEESVANGLSLGADDYLVKPIKPGELVAKITMLLRKRELASLGGGELPFGRLLGGKYQITGTIGSGGYSTVYYALDVTRTPKLPVALKVFHLPASQRADPGFAPRFLREAYQHARMEHPNIVKLFDFGQAESLYYLAMEFVAGQTIAQIVRENGPMTGRAVVLWAYEVAKALKYIADRGVVHRDVKPDNIIITHAGDVKLLDFGLARQQSDATLSLADEFRGSPQFVSPEYILGATDLDIRTDIYSLGVAMYFGVSDQFPWDATSSLEFLRCHLDCEPMPVLDHVPDLAEPLAHLIMQLIEKERSARPGIDELLANLLSLTYMV